jgi:Leucine-rich repeat (LRR) protein
MRTAEEGRCSETKTKTGGGAGALVETITPADCHRKGRGERSKSPKRPVGQASSSSETAAAAEEVSIGGGVGGRRAGYSGSPHDGVSLIVPSGVNIEEDLENSDRGGEKAIQAYVAGSSADTWRKTTSNTPATTTDVVIMAGVLANEDTVKARRRRRIYAALSVGCVLVLGVILGVTLGVPGNDDKLEDVPTLSPTTTNTVDVLDPQSVLEPYFGSLLWNESTVEHQAFQWLLEEDPRQNTTIDISLLSEEWRIIQRYVCALLFYSTGGPDHWTSTLNFLSDRHECDWSLPRPRTGQRGRIPMGIQCDISNPSSRQQRQINAIRIAENGMKYTLPSALGLLTSLETIDLLDNSLTGTLPSELSQLTGLNIIELSNNPIEGAIPEVLLESWLEIKIIGLADTQISGTIATEFGQMSQLQHLRLHLNELSGTLPTELEQLTNIRTLLLAGNQLSGTLPPSFAKLTNMQRFDISANLLSGTIPSLYRTSWQTYDEAWFLGYQRTPAPTVPPPPTPPPTISPSPTASYAPTTEECSIVSQVDLICPYIPPSDAFAPVKCAKQPYRMVYLFALRRCEESIIEDFENLEGGFDCADFEFDPTVDPYGVYYFVASADEAGNFVYSEGQLGARDRAIVTDPSSIEIADRLHLALYEFDEDTGIRGRILQRLSLSTACDSSSSSRRSSLAFLDIFGSFQLIEFESAFQHIRAHIPVDSVSYYLNVHVETSSGKDVELKFLSAVILPIPGVLPPQVLNYNVTTPFTAQAEVIIIPKLNFTVIVTAGGKASDGADCFGTSQHTVSCTRE